ncbi:MAG: N-acetylmuramic acid 6-phosphate etherase [Nitrospirae bacterium]|nr:N-acetylmuramic acid 6-phosphate etherase [Nitrospirota bacterium]
MNLTEMRNPRSKDLDIIPTGKAIEIFIGGEICGLKGIFKEKKSIERAIEAAAAVFKKGGRVFYIGAGTSGRIGVIDAAEVHPTFGTPKNKFQAVIAGGRKAVFSSAERAEDDVKSAADAVRTREIGAKDMVIGITASGRTPFVLAALNEAKKQRAETCLITFNKIQKPPFVDGLIKVLTGPEILAGSTRLKAGTATKVILNMISTLTMVRLGKVYQNLMVDVKPTNKKLRERAENIIREITGASEKEAEKFLKASKGNAKLAILMKVKKLSRNEAVKLLKKQEGMLRTALK